MTEKTVFTYDSAGNSIVFDMQGPFWIENISGCSSLDINVNETQGAGQIGSTISYMSIGTRDITVNGAIMDDVEKNRMVLLATVIPGVIARFTIAQNGSEYYLECCPKRTPDVSDGAVQNFQFVLHCAYPYWKSVINSSTQIAGLTSLFCFPCSLSGTWQLSKYSDSLFAVVLNGGNVPIEFDTIFTATTEVTNPELFNVDTNTFIRINKVMFAGEKVTVSTIYGKKGVVYTKSDTTTENGFRFLSVDSDINMRLKPGENTFRFSAQHNREGLQVKILAPKGVLAGV